MQNDDGHSPLSAVSLLYRAVIPFGNPSTGTLLATRWLTLGLFSSALVLAVMWVRTLVSGRSLAVVVSALVGAAVICNGDRLVDVTVVAAPLVLAAGWCMSGHGRFMRRLVAGGVLLGTAALSSRVGAGAAIGLGLWAVLNAKVSGGVLRVARKRTGAFVLGFLGATAVVVSGAFVLRVAIPAFTTDRPTSLVRPGVPSSLAFAALFLVVAGVLLADIASSSPRPGFRLDLGGRHAPLFALAGSCLGAVLEGSPVSVVAPLPILLSVLSVAGLLAPRERTHDGAPDASTGVSPVGAGTGGRFLDVLSVAVLVLVPVSLEASGLSKVSNRPQTRQMAYILERTRPSEAIFDPTGEVAVLRPRVERADLSRASFVVATPAVLARDPGLKNALVAAGFVETPVPDIWAAALSWSDSVASDGVVSDGVVSEVDRTSPPRGEVTDPGPGESLDWYHPMAEPFVS